MIDKWDEEVSLPKSPFFGMEGKPSRDENDHAMCCKKGGEDPEEGRKEEQKTHSRTLVLRRWTWEGTGANWKYAQ